MYNTIKFIDFPSLAEEFDNKKDDILVGMEKDESLLGEYFCYVDKKSHLVFFHSKKQNEVVNLIKNKLNISDLKIITLQIREYGEFLYQWYGDEDEELTFGDIGEGITITYAQIYASLMDEFLKEDEYVDRLINADDFKKEFTNIKKEVVQYLFQLTIDDAKMDFEMKLETLEL